MTEELHLAGLQYLLIMASKYTWRMGGGVGLEGHLKLAISNYRENFLSWCSLQLNDP